ncbi:MAG: hypothetical protein ACYC9V_04755, partial [Desulfobacteria bacterium]
DIQQVRDVGRSGGVPRSGVWSEVETGMSGTSGSAGEETMDGRRAVAEWKPPREPEVLTPNYHMLQYR